KAAVQKAYPEVKSPTCKEEREDGKVEYTVKLTTKDGRNLEIDISPEGRILLTEEVVDVKTLPTAVTKAFAAKYPTAKPTRAEKQTHEDGKVTYEIAFGSGKGKKEATFGEDGSLIEEEAEDEE